MTTAIADTKASEYLKANIKSAKMRYTPSDFTAAMLCAGKVAKRDNRPVYVFKGNSYMHLVFRVSVKLSDATNKINNTGGFIYTVTPDLEVTKQAN